MSPPIKNRISGNYLLRYKKATVRRKAGFSMILRHLWMPQEACHTVLRKFKRFTKPKPRREGEERSTTPRAL